MPYPVGRAAYVSPLPPPPPAPLRLAGSMPRRRCIASIVFGTPFSRCNLLVAGVYDYAYGFCLVSRGAHCCQPARIATRSVSVGQ